MTNETNNDPAKKMRTLLGGGQSSSPVARLPKKSGAITSLPLKSKEEKKDALDIKEPVIQKLPEPAAPSVAKRFKLNLGPAFWTIASAISMTVNIVLLIVILAVLPYLKTINPNYFLGLGNDLLGGLYSNFEKMDRAHITSTIPVETTIPVKFDLQLNQQTSVILSQDVTISNARVTVNTGGLNISNALTTIILPQGTTLPIVLNLTVPVDTTVPVILNVAVDIPLEQTQLHEPFSGLQDVVRPFYCMINAEAIGLDGQLICK